MNQDHEPMRTEETMQLVSAALAVLCVVGFALVVILGAAAAVLSVIR